MTEEKHECKTYAEMLAVLRELDAKGLERGKDYNWKREELFAGKLIIHITKEEDDE